MLLLHYNRSQVRKRHFGGAPLGSYVAQMRGVARTVLSLRAVSTALPIHLFVSGERYATCEQRLSGRLGVSVHAFDAPPPLGVSPPTWTDEWALGTFVKLRVLGMTQFERVIVLDNDVVVLRNVDHLASRAVVRTPSLVASSQNGGASTIMNSGVMVLKPDRDEYARMVGLVAAMEAAHSMTNLTNGRRAEYPLIDHGDQAVWHNFYLRFHELPAAYNVHGPDPFVRRTASNASFDATFIVHAHRGRRVTHPHFVARDDALSKQAERMMPGVGYLQREGPSLQHP